MLHVSIIMGVYNIGDKEILSKCIESILNQSYTEFEFIICDDASTDDTYTYLQEYEKKDSRIQLLQNKKNKGLAATLNRCIKQSRGQYIARQDADDYSHPNRLQMQLDYLESHPEIGFLGSNLHYFTGNQIWGSYQLPEKPMKRDFLFTVPFIHATVIFRSNALKKVGNYRVIKETIRCEDFDLFLRMYIQKIQGANIQTKLYYVREDTASKKRRKYRYRIHEAKIRLNGYRQLQLLPIGYLYAIKPLLVGLLPSLILDQLKDCHYKRKKVNQSSDEFY